MHYIDNLKDFLKFIESGTDWNINITISSDFYHAEVSNCGYTPGTAFHDIGFQFNFDGSLSELIFNMKEYSSDFSAIDELSAYMEREKEYTDINLDDVRWACNEIESMETQFRELNAALDDYEFLREQKKVNELSV